MDALNLDPGVNLKLVVRKAREHTLVFLAKDTSGNAYAIEDDFAFGVKRDPRDKNYLFRLTTTEEDEITVVGNELSVPLSEDLTNLDGAREYYFELVNLTQKKNWAQGPFVVLTGPTPSSPSSSSATLSVNLGDSVVKITVQGGEANVTEEAITEALGYIPDTLVGGVVSGTNTYTATLTPAPEYATGEKYILIFTNANTGPATLNLNGLGAKSIKKNVSEDLQAGDISAGQVLLLVYDGTNMQVVAGGQGGAGGVAKTYADITALIADQVNQQEDLFYLVSDASGDPTVDAGWAVYQKLAASTGALADYRKLSEQESMDVIFDVPDASESVAGKVEEATDAEMQAGTATGGTGAKLFSSPAKLSTWWTWLKTQAQSFANLTATAFKLTGQIESGKRVSLYIDTDGALKKLGWVEIDPETQKISKTGVDDVSGSVLEEWKNLSGDLIMQILNGRAVNIGGSTFAIVVDDNIPSGAAYLEINANQTQAFKIVDKNGNVIEEIRTTTGALHKRIFQRLQLDQLSGEGVTEFIQFTAISATSDGSETMIGSIPLIEEEFATLRTQWIVAAMDGDGGGCDINATLRRDSLGTVSIIGVQDKGAGERRVAASGTPDWSCAIEADDVNKTAKLKFTNNSVAGTAKAFKVVVNVWYMKTLEPNI